MVRMMKTLGQQVQFHTPTAPFVKHTPHPNARCCAAQSDRAASVQVRKDDTYAALQTSRRVLMGVLATGALVVPSLCVSSPAYADDFTTTPSGLKYLELKKGEGATPQTGDRVVVHWAGYTKGYQGKRIDNTSVRDEPYEFVLGSHEAIPAFEEAVQAMQVGGILRVEVSGEIPQLGYPRDRSQRFTNELVPSKEGKIFKYRYGPQPVELGGQRALDFVLDNQTLNDFNRTLLFDIKLLAVRKPRPDTL